MDKKTAEAAKACLVAAVKIKPGMADRMSLVNVLMFAGLVRDDAEVVVTDAIVNHLIVRTSDSGYAAPA